MEGSFNFLEKKMMRMENILGDHLLLRGSLNDTAQINRMSKSILKTARGKGDKVIFDYSKIKIK